MIHTIALFFLFVTYLEQTYKFEETTWLEEYNLSNLHWTKIYCYAVYYSVTTMTAIGYGDYVAKTTTETIYVIFAMMIASFTFAYTFNSIG